MVISSVFETYEVMTRYAMRACFGYAEHEILLCFIRTCYYALVAIPFHCRHLCCCLLSASYFINTKRQESLIIATLFILFIRHAYAIISFEVIHADMFRRIIEISLRSLSPFAGERRGLATYAMPVTLSMLRAIFFSPACFYAILPPTPAFI